MDNYLIIYINDNLLLGGIETYIYKQIKQYKENKNVHFCWIGAKKPLIDKIFKELFIEQSVLTIKRKIKIKALKKYCKDLHIDYVKIITFDPFKFAKAEMLKNKLKPLKVDTFYFVPHFEGETLYLEEGEKAEKRKNAVNRKIAPLFKKMQANDNIKYFSQTHILKMTDNYGYVVDDEIGGLVPPNIEVRQFNISEKKALYQRDVFKILSISRFEFPHKGYLIGLIRAFALLKEKYSNLELIIVGYGGHKFLIDEEISKIDQKIKQSIKLVGAVPPDELFEYYDDANINISLAGACSNGAKRGCLSIPVRHYTYECEVYGFLPQSKSHIVSTKPGNSVIEIIENVIHMTEEEYIQKCLDSFNTFSLETEKNRKSLLEINNKNRDATLAKSEIKYLNKRYKKYLLKSTWRAYLIVFKREGVFKPIIRKIKKLLKKADE